MPLSNNRLLYLKPVAAGLPVVGENYRFDKHPYDLTLPDNGIIVKLLYSSIDPYYRGRFVPLSTKSYSAPYVPNEPLKGRSVGEVTESSSPEFKVGDSVQVDNQFLSEYIAVAPEELHLVRKLPQDSSIPNYAYLGTFGSTGLTAYVAVHTVGQVKKGQTVFVSGAAGAVGLIAVQLAVLAGATVIGSTSSQRKIDLLKKAGVHHAINYKTQSLDEELAKAAPNGIDVYIDQVGEETLDLALKNSNFYAKFVEVGQIATYNATRGYEYKYLGRIVQRSLTLRGFVSRDKLASYDEYYNFITSYYKAGKIIDEYDIREGLQSGEQALLDLFSSKNNGKLLVKY